jgi:hypothetical protein
MGNSYFTPQLDVLTGLYVRPDRGIEFNSDAPSFRDSAIVEPYPPNA